MRTEILVVGGAGYIGSHMVKHLLRIGLTPVVIDNLSTGHRGAVQQAECLIGNMADPVFLDAVFATHTFSAVMHFASFIQVGESVTDPQKYYLNNVAATLHLLNTMLKYKVKHFIFSSTAAVYGEPEYMPIDEQHPLKPINPYGHSKRMVEQVLQDYAQAYDFHFTALRYFNAAGADPDGTLFECHDPETHLIPLVLQAAHQTRPSVTVYGRDYATPDGTCIRDYIHVNDLSEAHALALQQLWHGKTSSIYNLGTGQGYSVQQVIETVEMVTGTKISVIEGQRRAGDPAILVADAVLAKQQLGWQPKYSALKTIVEHANAAFMGSLTKF